MEKIYHHTFYNELPIARSVGNRPGHQETQHTRAHPHPHSRFLPLPTTPSLALNAIPPHLRWGPRAVRAAHPKPLNGPACYAAAPVPNTQDAAAAGPSSSSTTDMPPPPMPPVLHETTYNSLFRLDLDIRCNLDSNKLTMLLPATMKIRIVAECKCILTLLSTSRNLWYSKQGMATSGRRCNPVLGYGSEIKMVYAPPRCTRTICACLNSLLAAIVSRLPVSMSVSASHGSSAASHGYQKCLEVQERMES
ncbi:hypothetical protein B0H11DRAFT_2204316 [Mycena galericulata]|nr:hypothetical protein B0H11DRAFT_2204316 [Mycena galericulata]